jgi:hypothetical protein
MTTWRSRALLLLLCSCGSSAPETKSPAEWLDTARATLRGPLHASFSLETGDGTARSGRLHVEDARHFRVESTSALVYTEPDGSTGTMELAILCAADGHQLRIKTPPLFGSAGSVAVFPLARLEELVAVDARSPLGRFRPVILNPAATASKLLEECTDLREDGVNPERSLAFVAGLDRQVLVELGLPCPVETEGGLELRFDLLEEDGWPSGLRIVEEEEVRWQLELSRTRPDGAPDTYSLDVPDGYDVVDLSLQLPHDPLPR